MSWSSFVLHAPRTRACPPSRTPLLPRSRCSSPRSLSLPAVAASTCSPRPSRSPRTPPSRRSPPPDAAPFAALPSHHITQRASFAVADVSLTITDLQMLTRLDDVLAKTSADVVVNGGFFGQGGEPIGLAVSEGHPLSRFSPLMSGGVLWVRDGTAHLSPTEEYREPSVDFRGPVSAAARRRVAGEHPERRRTSRRADRPLPARRGADDRGRDRARRARRRGPHLPPARRRAARGGCEDALNLDGGPLTAWASPSDHGVVFSPPLAPVRHAIVVRRHR